MGVGLITAAFITSLMMQGSLCHDWRVVLPKSLSAIEGSCLRVPCSFEVPRSYHDDLHNCTVGIWKKGGVSGQDVFTSGESKYSNTIQGEITGDLTRRDCTTVFRSFPKGYNDAYFFRLDCFNRLKYTFDTPVYINFQSAPPPPKPSPVREVSEGNQLRLQCSAPVPCPALPPTLTWLPWEGRRDQVIEAQQSQDTMTSTLTFSASSRHHNQTITCSVFYPLAQGGSSEPSTSTQTLSVQYRPRDTVVAISPSDPVPEGRAVTLTCSSDANPPVHHYTWFQDVNGQLNRIGEGDQLVFISRNNSAIYLCEAQNQRGSDRSRPVAVEVALPTGGSEGPVLLPVILCVMVVVLFVLTVIVIVFKYQSLSRRLKQIEKELKEKGEHTYTALTHSSITSDYDQLSSTQPRAASHVEARGNENPITMATRGQRSA